MKVYGVFIENKLIFGGDMMYAIYERRNFAESKLRELEGYFNCKYEVREIEIDCEIASGIFIEGVTNK